MSEHGDVEYKVSKRKRSARSSTGKNAFVSDTVAVDNVFKLDSFLPHQVLLTSKHMARHLRSELLDKCNIDISQWQVLSIVGMYGITPPSSIMRATYMDKVRVSRAAKSLSDRGLLVQFPHPKDKRAHLLRMTRKGKMLYSDMISLSLEIQTKFAEGLTEDEWDTLQLLLSKIDNHVVAIKTRL